MDHLRAAATASRAPPASACAFAATGAKEGTNSFGSTYYRSPNPNPDPDPHPDRNNPPGLTLPFTLTLTLTLTLTRYYRGPAKGSTTTFKLYALSGRLEIPKGSTKEAVVAAMKGKVLSKATLATTA